MTSLKVTKTTQHKLTTTPTTMRSDKKLHMNLNSVQIRQGTRKHADDSINSNSQKKSSSTAILPPPVVETVVSSSQSLTSSIGIGEFGMNPARRGSAVAFSMAVKDHLFPKLKFLKGTNASLDFSMDPTSICGYLCVCCGVSEADAYQWWDDHRGMLKTIHTDFRNNKIKMIKQQFNGKLQYYLE